MTIRHSSLHLQLFSCSSTFLTSPKLCSKKPCVQTQAFFDNIIDHQKIIHAKFYGVVWQFSVLEFQSLNQCNDLVTIFYPTTLQSLTEHSVILSVRR